jgi:hypothetical protein
MLDFIFHVLAEAGKTVQDLTFQVARACDCDKGESRLIASKSSYKKRGMIHLQRDELSHKCLLKSFMALHSLRVLFNSFAKKRHKMNSFALKAAR